MINVCISEINITHIIGGYLLFIMSLSATSTSILLVDSLAVEVSLKV